MMCDDANDGDDLEGGTCDYNASGRVSNYTRSMMTVLKIKLELNGIAQDKDCATEKNTDFQINEQTNRQNTFFPWQEE